MNEVMVSIRSFVVLSFLTGALYPLAVTAIGRVASSAQSHGSLVESKGQVVGSELIGQDFKSPRYFWGRPSASTYGAVPSGASNLGPTSAALVALVATRRAALTEVDAAIGPPADLLLASGSGLDPHISPAAARFQIARLSRERGLSRDQLTEIIERSIEPRQWGIFGEARVNVLRLNIALDHASKNGSMP